MKKRKKSSGRAAYLMYLRDTRHCSAPGTMVNFNGKNYIVGITCEFFIFLFSKKGSALRIKWKDWDGNFKILNKQPFWHKGIKLAIEKELSKIEKIMSSLKGIKRRPAIKRKPAIRKENKK